MQDAKSMYRGGDIIAAKDCDFDSSRSLGLVCPFCNEAVYLRASTTRDRNGKFHFVNPAFCHYPGSAESLDCERRSCSAAGRAEIERVKAEKRGQRLELYNKHLWDMIATCGRPVPRVSRMSEAINRHMPEFGIALRSFKENFPIPPTWESKEIDELIEFPFAHGEFHYRLETPETGWERVARCLIESTSTFCFHKAVVNEVTDFLQTKTSGFCFEKIVKYCLWDYFYGDADEFGDAYINVNDKWSLSDFLADEDEDDYDDDTNGTAPRATPFSIILYTPWEVQIERFSNPNRKAADERYNNLWQKYFSNAA